MTDKCFEFGELQAFLDGELVSARSEAVARHISLCNSCAIKIGDLEQETESVFAALGGELDVLVPTERLKTKVFASIKEFEEKENRGFWRKLFSISFANPLLSQPAGAFAVIMVLAAIGFVGLGYWEDANSKSVIARVSPSESQAGSESSDVGTTAVDPEQVDMTQTVAAEVDEPPQSGNAGPVEFVAAIHTIQPKPVVRKTLPNAAKPPVENVEENRFPSAEAGYIRTISALNRTVNDNKDYVLRPSERVVFERDLAVVNDAIRRMRDEVKDNPNNNAAREVLQSSYKNKIDLLNSVAQRSNTGAAFD